MQWYANSIKLAYPTHLVVRVQDAGSCNAFAYMPVLPFEMNFILPLKELLNDLCFGETPSMLSNRLGALATPYFARCWTRKLRSDHSPEQKTRHRSLIWQPPPPQQQQQQQQLLLLLLLLLLLRPPPPPTTPLGVLYPTPKLCDFLSWFEICVAGHGTFPNL